MKTLTDKLKMFCFSHDVLKWTSNFRVIGESLSKSMSLALYCLSKTQTGSVVILPQHRPLIKLCCHREFKAP